MKYANYKLNGRDIDNLGDQMQIIAIDYLYEYMGIDKCNIIYIDKNELDRYDGEYVILPISMPLIEYKEGGICDFFSSRIIPVFIGITLVKNNLSNKEISYYKRFEPIGCRDEKTLLMMRKYGIMSYLNGCITAALPKCSEDRSKLKKIYMVDAPQSIKDYIPKSMLDNIIETTHIYNNLENPKLKALEQYDMYKKDASMVITSLLHCSIPCLAAGIPVILVRDSSIPPYRYGWLETLLNLYTVDNFKDIDWNPKSKEYEEHKRLILKVASNQINTSYNKYSLIYDLSYYYEEREKTEYSIDGFDTIKQFLDLQWKQNKEYKYSIWGLTQLSEVIVEYIKSRYAHAELVGVYDGYRELNFEGIKSTNPDLIENNDEYVLVTSIAARESAKALFNKIKKDTNKYVYI